MSDDDRKAMRQREKLQAELQAKREAELWALARHATSASASSNESNPALVELHEARQRAAHEFQIAQRAYTAAENKLLEEAKAEAEREREAYLKSPEYLNQKREREAEELAKWKETIRETFKTTLNLFDFVMEEMAGTRSESEKHTLAIMLMVQVAGQNITENMPEFECRAD